MSTPNTLAVVVALTAAATLAACGASEPDAEQPATSSAAPAEDTPDAWMPLNRTGDLTEWSDVIVSAIETEAGRITVQTNLTDASPADVPTAICEAAAGLDGVTYVSVAESDGTAWVLYGHPAYPDGVCSVV